MLSLRKKTGVEVSHYCLTTGGEGRESVMGGFIEVVLPHDKIKYYPSLFRLYCIFCYAFHMLRHVDYCYS